jgi:hypothetical protein
MSCADNSSSDARVAGLEAWGRLQTRVSHTFSDWLLVGTALAAIQTDAMVAAKMNEPEGRRYCREFGILLREAGLDAVDKAARSRLLKVLEHRDEIETWLATLEPPAERVKLNHPSAVWAAWSKAMGLGTSKPKPIAKPEPFAILWKSATIKERRAALDAGGIDLILEGISPELRAEITRRLKPVKPGDTILGERIRKEVDEIRSLFAHPEQNKVEINRKLTAIKSATRGVGKAPTTMPIKEYPGIGEALKAMGNGVDPRGETAAAISEVRS